MIVLTVISFNGAPAPGASANFDELGGTIGRADQNQLVLPDPERTISRVHARILYRNGGYVIVDNGSNPISVNGRPAGPGVELPLRPGDKLAIGGYELTVSDGAAVRSDDPFADLFGDGLALDGAPPAPAPLSAPARAAPSLTPPRPAAPATPHAPAASYAPLAAPAPPARPASPALIPEDWDPFAPDPVEAPPAAPAAGHDPLSGLMAAAPAESSLDDLFGLGPGGGTADPLAAAMPAAPGHGAVQADPLAGFGLPPKAPPATAGDLGSELNTPMPLPRSTAPAARPARAQAPPSGAVFSWDEGGLDASVKTAPDARRVPAPPAAAPPAAPATPPLRPVQSAAGPAAAAGSAAPAGLREAFLEGLGAPALPLRALDEDTMRLVGQLLREATRGTVELLVARAALKRELRAEMTMIVARENNPLKFSPGVDVALQHLLGPPMGGFMPPARAMRDAFDDLRAHQLGVMAGMRAALEGVLQRFDPAQLEAKLTQRSSIANLIPASRKARLWELFQELFAQLQGEAQEDFEELFGKAFLRAYEQHIDRLGSEPGPD